MLLLYFRIVYASLCKRLIARASVLKASCPYTYMSGRYSTYYFIGLNIFINHSSGANYCAFAYVNILQYGGSYAYKCVIIYGDGLENA